MARFRPIWAIDGNGVQAAAPSVIMIATASVRFIFISLSKRTLEYIKLNLGVGELKPMLITETAHAPLGRLPQRLAAPYERLPATAPDFASRRSSSSERCFSTALMRLPATVTIAIRDGVAMLVVFAAAAAVAAAVVSADCAK